MPARKALSLAPNASSTHAPAASPTSAPAALRSLAPAASPTSAPAASIMLCLGLSIVLSLSLSCSNLDPPSVARPDAHGPGADLPSLGGAALDVVLLEDFTSRQIFPASNWWNLDISQAPVDPNSQDYIDWISGRTPQNPLAMRRMHPDFGPPPYGIPYVGVSGAQPLLPVTFVDYPSESDAGAPGRPPGYPIPGEARDLPNYIEGGVPGGGDEGDRHLLLIDRDNWLLFETWATRWDEGLARWEAGSGAAWDMNANGRRPETWTSADAAGLAIFPGLVKYDEANGAGPIRHAFRFTTRATNGYVWPASHAAGSTPGAPPMGTRLRMKAGVDLSGYPLALQRIFQAMKTYGLILADNGTDMYVTGTMDPRWDNDILNPAFHSLYADDFEVIALGWNPTPTGVGGPADESVRP